MLDHVYGIEKPMLTLAQAVTLFKISDKYSLSRLHQQCVRVLRLMITEGNLQYIQGLAYRHSSTGLFEVCAFLL